MLPALHRASFFTPIAIALAIALPARRGLRSFADTATFTAVAEAVGLRK